MQISYTANYLKIYFWQGVSLVLNFLALFIVVPYLSSQPVIYGLYSVCIGLAIFLSYADLGFLSAGSKYAAEYHAQGNKKKEAETIGFTGFILSIFLFLLACFFIYCSFNPDLIIKDLVIGQETKIASSLFLILALSVPSALLQRILQIIFSIRLEDYVIQRINIIGSLIRIVSVFFFFANGAYQIVGYYAFTQIVIFIISLVSLYIARRRYSYNFIDLFKNFRFSQEIFNKVKPLALSSLFLTVCWILYYEIDPFVIGKISGAEKVSFFAIGLTLLGFFRSLFGIVFSPFSARFNHFIGQRDIEGLKIFFFEIVKTFVPLVVFPIICLVILASPFVLSWVGFQYQDSIIIVRWLLLCNLFAFITYPVSMLLMGLERVKEMYLISAIITVTYWLGVSLSYANWGLKSFAIFKFIAFFISAIAYIFFAAKFLNMSVRNFIYQVTKTLIIPMAFLVISSYIVVGYLPLEKSKENLFVVLATAGIILSLTFIIQVLFSRESREKIADILYNLKKKKYESY